VANGIALCVKKKMAEEELRHNEVRRAAVLESALDGIITMDAEGRIIEFNLAAERIFGRDRREVVGMPLAEVIIPPSWREKHVQGLKRYLATGLSITHISGRSLAAELSENLARKKILRFCWTHLPSLCRLPARLVS